jgi:hypothetical protein
LAGHKADHKKGRGCSSVQIVQCPTAYIELLEECEEGVRYVRERWWIENTPNCVNKIVPGRTRKEYRASHREERRVYNKAYREKRKLKSES